MEPHEAGESGPNKVPVADGGREITLETLVHATALTVGKHEQLSHFLKRVTHLKLQGDASAGGKGNNRGKMIRRLQNLHHCPNLQVLYLYDNEVEAIETLEQDVPQLSHLYLQNNRVREMRGLAGLQQLEKLFLSGNRIARLEGFANGGGWNLQELHLSNQSLSPSVTFSFDQDTLQSLSRSLRVLSLANSRVADPRPLAVLRGLETLDLSRNLVSELEDVFELLAGLPMLEELDLSQNSVASMPKYRERSITFSSARLRLLDKKDVDANQRRMMQSHMAHKFRKHQEASAPSRSSEPSMAMGGSVAESKRMIKHGTATHQLRSVHVTAMGVGRLSSDRGLSLSDGLGIAGASCAPVSSAALVRAHSSNNSRHE